jgi:hypothetical protein
MASASAERSLNLQPGLELHGFVVESREPLPEIGGTAYVLRHRGSTTPVLWLANDDENMSFSIAFATPPADDTGVFHILEHSVLCGSDRYPVKEPFVDLLKTSMQTFLNALTFSDKTVYPVASTNEQDLLNLMDVYMDAVLHPALYRKRAVFEQEGWHYELAEGKGEGADGERRLVYNGVVLNEMKGALSDPDEAVLDGLARALFPDTCYGFVSGGDPRAIPTLTYESYCDTHRRHYNLANAKIVLYGDVSLTRELAWLDERYLSCAEKPAGAPNPLAVQRPVCDFGSTVELATSPDNRTVALGWVLGTYAERDRILAASVLSDALFGSNEAPLKRELLDADLGCDVDAFVYDGLLQPYFVVELRGADEGVAERFRTLVDGAFARVAREGVPRANVEAALSAAAFALREGDFGYADGVAYAINALSGWLYDDGAATTYLHYEDALARLRAGLDDGLWEDLVRTAFVENPHRAACELVPVDEGGSAAAETAELAAAAERLGADGLARVEAEVAELRRLQETPDAPEDAATLPRLQLSDIGPAREEPAFGPVDAPLACLYHDLPTHGIDYVYHYFDLSCLTWDELPYAVLACSLLGKLGTARHTASELDTLLESRLGRLTFACEVHRDVPTGEATPRLVVCASALSENLNDLAELPREVWATTDFGDLDRIRDVLEQQRLEYEQSFAASGNSYAAARALGYTSKAALLSQHLGNVDYYRFVRNLLATWDEAACALPQRLAQTCGRALRADGCLSSFTGARSDLARFWDLAGDLGLERGGAGAKRLVVPEPQLLNEAFVVPADVCFVAQADSGDHTRASYSGAWAVASRALNYDYLWNEVRVKGGAYGCSFRAGTDGSMAFSTFRDPNLDATLERFAGAAGWLAGFDPSAEELCGYVVSTVAAHDAPQKARQTARRQDLAHLTRRDPAWRGQIRAQELAATAKQIRALAENVAPVAERGAVCVFGGREAIERSAAGLAVVDLLA